PRGRVGNVPCRRVSLPASTHGGRSPASPVRWNAEVLPMDTLAATLPVEMPRPVHHATKPMMQANVFHGVDDIRIDEVPRPSPGPGEALLRVTLTTICGTDLHIVRGEYPVRPGLVIGHEPVGVIEELGVGVTGYDVGQRVLVGAITPC